MPDSFTREELDDIERRARELSTEPETDAGLRAALQLLAEAAANVGSRIAPGDAAP